MTMCAMIDNVPAVLLHLTLFISSVILPYQEPSTTAIWDIPKRITVLSINALTLDKNLNWDQVESKQEFASIFSWNARYGKCCTTIKYSNYPNGAFYTFHWHVSLGFDILLLCISRSLSHKSAKVVQLFWIWILAYYLLMLKLQGKARKN